ncbi:hypothetical protein P3846_18150 [Pseudomonas aeruginosa]|nr:hypothetical protein [Pseudomonas aeruginosa]
MPDCASTLATFAPMRTGSALSADCFCRRVSDSFRNPFRVEAEGKTFEEMKVYQNNKDRVRGIVRIARQTGSTFGEDVKLMLDSKLTFDEIKQSPDFGLMSKSRLSKVKTAIFEQLATII